MMRLILKAGTGRWIEAQLKTSLSMTLTQEITIEVKLWGKYW